MVSKTVAVAAVAGAAFLGYCVYFDRKRRSDPDFRRKLKERRRRAKESKAGAKKSQFPDLRNTAEVQKYFLEEIQRGEELLGEGKFEEGVDHLTNAIAVCGQPRQLLQVLQQTLPPQVYAMILQQLPTVNERVASSMMMGGGTEVSKSPEKPKMESKPKTEPGTIADVDELE